MNKNWIIGGITNCDNVRFMSPKALEPLVSLVPPLERGTTHCTHEEEWQKGLWVLDVKRAKKMSASCAKELVKMLQASYTGRRAAKIGKVTMRPRIKIKAMTVEQGLAYMVSNELRAATEDEEAVIDGV